MKKRASHPQLLTLQGQTRIYIFGVLAIALCSLAISLSLVMVKNKVQTTANNNPEKKETALARIQREGIIRVGYAGFPPYAMINPSESDPNKRMQGFAVDLVNEIARRNVPPLKVEWHVISWDTLKSDIQSKKFDFIAEPIYQTVSRAMDVGFSDPYSYFPVAVAVVRKNETRFATFGDLDRPDITIVLAEGWTSSEFARDHLSKPTLKSIPVGGDAFVQLDDVLLGRADVALQDSPTVVQYVKAHVNKVKALWLDKPPSMVPGCFATAKEDIDLLAFLNTCIRVMKMDGTLAALDKKWNSYGYFEKITLTPGAGLRSFLSNAK